MSESPVAPRPVEVELKYRLLESAAGDRYLAGEDIGGFRPISPVRSSQLEDRYLDTADGALARAGFAVRLRQTARGTTVSIKSTARRPSAPAIHRREELEGPADRTAQPRDWPHSDARSLVLELCGDAPLVELVTIRQLRRIRQLESEGTIVELSLDEVDAVARSRVVQRFVELEVELLEGDDTGLDGIEAVLSADPGLAVSTGSKLESALQAIRSTGSSQGRRAATVLPFIESAGRAPHAESVAPPPGGPVTAPHAEPAATPPKTAPPAGEPVRLRPKPEPGIQTTDSGTGTIAPARSRPRLAVGRFPGVLADDHVAEAARKLLRFHLATMLANEPVALTAPQADADGLLTMGASVARQSAVWRAFGSAFERHETEAHRAGVLNLERRLAAVGEVDARLDAAEAYRSALPAAEQRALERLLGGWRAQRDDARRLLGGELESDGFSRWLDEYADFVRRAGMAAIAVGATVPHRIRDTTGSRILAAYEAVRAFEPFLRGEDLETLRELGASATQLRDAMELVQEVLGPDAEELIARASALVEHTRALEAANVAARLARSCLVEHGDELRPLEAKAVTRYAETCEQEVTTLRRTVGGPWRGVTGSPFRRALARTIASL